MSDSMQYETQPKVLKKVNHAVILWEARWFNS